MKSTRITPSHKLLQPKSVVRNKGNDADSILFLAMFNPLSPTTTHRKIIKIALPNDQIQINNLNVFCKRQCIIIILIMALCNVYPRVKDTLYRSIQGYTTDTTKIQITT